MKKILITLLALTLFISVIGLVSAVADDDISYFYKHGEAFNITRECFYNGAYCNQTIFMCFITILAPNQTNILNNSQMTGTVNYYYKPIPYTDWPNGVYRSTMSCGDGTNYGSEIFYFKVNTTGDNRTDALFLILALSSVILLALSIFMQNEYAGFISGCLWVTLGVYTLIFGFSNISDMYTRSVGYIAIGFGAIFLISSGYKVAESNDINLGGSSIDPDDF